MTLKTNKSKPKNKPLGFTIIELLVVIVIIGILAAITIVSYTGITAKANESSIKAELANASKKLSMYYAQYESYPTTPGLNLTTGCPTLPNNDTNYCIKFNPDTTIAYKSDNSNSYDLTFTKNNLTFTISQSGTIAAGTPAPTLPESDWITVGTQRWARKNLNVGTMIQGNINTSNDSNIEKYCYGNNEDNCATYGGLYQWDEAMNYSTTEGAQGVCPAGSHIPSDNDWKFLMMHLGMSQAMADWSGSYIGTNEGLQLKAGGSTGLDILLAGMRSTSGEFVYITSRIFLWSSTLSSGQNSITIDLSDNEVGIERGSGSNYHGFAVRCLGN